MEDDSLYEPAPFTGGNEDSDDAELRRLDAEIVQRKKTRHRLELARM